MITFSKPLIGSDEKKAVFSVLESGMLAQGIWVEKFEHEFARFCNTKYAVATSNGTTALYLALLAHGIGKGDEVITSPFSFIATANAIQFVGAKPVFADIDPQTFNIDPEFIESVITSRTKAILPVHLFGLPADMEKINRIARKYKLIVIEDACQAHGAQINGKRVGSFGTGCFSFYPTKNMTSGEGGMVTTNDSIVADKMKMLRNHGMKQKYHHDILGYNFRMTDIHAAIGVNQLNKLERWNRIRIKNAQFLTDHLQDIMDCPTVPKGYRHVYHQYTIKILKFRDKVQKKLYEKGVDSAVYYPIPIHQQKVYTEICKHQKFPVSEKLAGQVLSLPVHPHLSKSDLLQIVSEVRRAIKN